MPKEQIRKRGKRKTKQEDEYAGPSTTAFLPSVEAIIDVRPQPQSQSYSTAASSSSAVAGPSAIHPARAALLKGERYIPPPSDIQAHASAQEIQGDGAGAEFSADGQAQWTRGPRVDQEFPFGVVDPDLKAYFRNVEEQIKDWEGTSSVGEEREDRKQFLTAILGELRTHELPLSTDPECSVVLERLLPSMGDRGRRVLGDSFAGSWETLIRHRFGSHVVQSWIRLGADALEREVAERQPASSTSVKEEDSLPSMTELFTGLIETLRPVLPSLLTHAHAAPPVRLLFLVLAPNKALPDLNGDTKGTAVRSKKSNKYRKNHAVEGKGFLGDEADLSAGGIEKGKGKEGRGRVNRQVPNELISLGKDVRAELVKGVGAGEWRIMGMDLVGSATIQLTLDLEVQDGLSEQSDSLLDALTEGLVTEQLTDAKPAAKQYIPSLLSTQPGTHLLEAILTFCPTRIFNAIWTLYFVGKIGRLAVHPMSNYVIGRAVARLNVDGIEGVVRECRAVAGGKGMIKTGRTSVLQALVERAAQLKESQVSVLDLISQLVISALALSDSDKAFIVPCLMSLKTHPAYRAALSGEAEPEEDGDLPEDALDKEAETAAAAAAKYSAWQNRRTGRNATAGTGVEPNIKGSLLLQGLMALQRANDTVLESLFSQPSETLLMYATNPLSSRFLDVILTHPAVAPKWKRKLMLGYMGKYKELAQDRIGSRVVDTVWDNADGFMKEKIARSLAPHATTLSNSPFGRFCSYKLKLHLLQRRPDEWKEEVLGLKHHFAPQQQRRPIDIAAEASMRARNMGDGRDGEESKVIMDADVEVDTAGGRKRKANGSEVKPDQKERETDAIDDLFAGVEKSKAKKSKKVRA